MPSSWWPLLHLEASSCPQNYPSLLPCRWILGESLNISTPYSSHWHQNVPEPGFLPVTGLLRKPWGSIPSRGARLTLNTQDSELWVWGAVGSSHSSPHCWQEAGYHLTCFLSKWRPVSMNENWVSPRAEQIVTYMNTSWFVFSIFQIPRPNSN